MTFVVVLVALAVVVAVSRSAVASDLSPTIAGADASGFGGGRGSVDWRSAATLARGESRRLLRHPAFLAGLVLTLLALTLTNGPGPRQLHVWGPELTLRLVPLGWFTILAANLAALRARRHGTVELYATTPATPATVTAAHLLSAMAAALVGAVLVTGAVAAELVLAEPVGRLDPAEVVIGVLVVGGAVVVGVAVSRWLPWFVFGFAAVIAVTVLQALLGSSQTGTLRFFAFGAPTGSAGHPFLEDRPSVWHAVFVAAMTVLLAGVALARHGRGRVAVGVLVAGAVVASGAGWAQSRPMDDREARVRAGFLAGDGDAYRCEDVAGVRYCAFRGGAEPIAEWAAVVGAVVERLPSDAPRPELVEQRPPTMIGNEDCGRSDYPEMLLAPVRDRIEPSRIWPADDHLHPTMAWPERFPCGGDAEGGLFLATQAGAAAVGLPPALAWGELRCRADGQARSQIALWLGAQSSPVAAEALAALLEDDGAWRGPHMDFPTGPHGSGWDSPPVWAVAWHSDDVRGALRLAERAPAEVAAALGPHWARLTDPSTPASEISALLGGDRSPAPAAPLAAGGGRCR